MFRKGSTRRKSLVASVAILALGAALTACSSEGDSGAAAASAADPRGELETTTWKAGYIPAIHNSPIFYGIDAGIFDDYGLTIAPDTIASGAASITQLVSGELNSGFSNLFSIAFAKLQGIDLRIIMNGAAAAPGFGYVEAMPDSQIQGPEDLIGKTVAVPAVRNVGDIGIMAILNEMGLDGSKVNFVEVPFGQMASALEQGTVDAAWMGQPFANNAKKALNTKTVLDYADGTLVEGFQENVYVVDAGWAEAHPNTVAAFQCALNRSIEDLLADDALRIKAMMDMTGLPQDVVEPISGVAWNPGVTPDRYQQASDLMLEMGLSDEPVDFRELSIPMPDKC